MRKPLDRGGFKGELAQRMSAPYTKNRTTADLVVVYHGALWPGSTSLQRYEAFRAIEGVRAVPVDTGTKPGDKATFVQRLRWKIGLPQDHYRENEKLLHAVEDARPDIVMIDSSRVLTRRTLKKCRDIGVRCMAFYSPDDLVAGHSLSLRLRRSLPDWDVVFTTKSFNVAELADMGVKGPYLVGKAYDPDLHRPMTAQEVGPEFESFDLVFIGAYEKERCASINACAEAGMSVVVYGGELAGWSRLLLHPRAVLRDAMLNRDYVRSMHHGRIALCFLRKINRDRITQRSMEITAMARPMLAEKTSEHDEVFSDGTEYVGFTTDGDLVSKARRLLSDDAARHNLAGAGRRRCLSSGYSTLDRAREMLNVMCKAIDDKTARGRSGETLMTFSNSN